MLRSFGGKINEKFLTIEGDDINRIKNGIVNTLFTSLNLDRAKPSVDMATNTENSFNENHTTKKRCTSCSYMLGIIAGVGRIEIRFYSFGGES